MSGNWTDSEIRELLSIRADHEINRQLCGTVRDAVVYDKITNILRERGVTRQKAQIISKLKSLRKKFLQMNDHHGNSGSGRLSWPYYDMCQSMWGNNHSANPVALLSSLEPVSAKNANGEVNGAVASDSGDVQEDEAESATETRPESHQPPKKKAAKNLPRLQQMSEDMQKLFAEMDRDFHHRESVRIQEQREYEDRLRKEAKEEIREERAWQMAMWKEMQESQNNLFREFLSRLPLPSPPPPPEQ
ncbi:hypothetical protein AAFF_G00157390 [Aldrovandia affinis]|uniref:Myb/SANT-like DNA-binding domain-containing protein n=1 Tax=Aldrovandia affinis TaxID=143900 RepID=A0AAD7RNH6_9TELE|nr:hypothetical protein AAFF_G00157390 [Aldrovandia affinis]